MSRKGGSAPIYYANNIFKFISHDKATEEKNGFNGFTVDVQFLKSRTAPAGQISTLVYDQNLGFDRARTMFNYLSTAGMIGGSRKNARYVIGHEDVKFNELDFHNEFFSREDVRNAVMDVMIPMLRNNMFRVENGKFTNPELGVHENAIDSILNM
jgi:hypothetical protein